MKNSTFSYRSVVFKDIPEYKYQATLVWPQTSKKPSSACFLTPDELNQVMLRFTEEANRPKFNMSWVTQSASPTPSQSSSNNSIKLFGNGPPGFPLHPGFQALLNNDSKAKFDHDLPLEALLDGDADDIDNETEILVWIKQFLQNELGKAGVNEIGRAHV